MLIVLSVDTGALIVATIVTMLPLDSATIIKPPRCVFRPRMNRFWYIRKIRRKSTMVPILFCSHWNRQNRSRETQVLIWKYYKICSTAAHWIGYFPSLEYLENRQSVSLWTWNWMSSGYQIGSKQRWIRHPDDGSKSQTVRNPLPRPPPCHIMKYISTVIVKVHWSIILSGTIHSWWRWCRLQSNVYPKPLPLPE